MTITDKQLDEWEFLASRSPTVYDLGWRKPIIDLIAEVRRLREENARLREHSREAQRLRSVIENRDEDIERMNIAMDRLVKSQDLKP